VLEGGYVTVHRARDRVSGGTKSTKGKRGRRVPIEENLRPLLEELTKDRDDDAPLVVVPEGEATMTRAGRLREHLRAAGVDRAEANRSGIAHKPRKAMKSGAGHGIRTRDIQLGKVQGSAPDLRFHRERCTFKVVSHGFPTSFPPLRPTAGGVRLRQSTTGGGA